VGGRGWWLPVVEKFVEARVVPVGPTPPGMMVSHFLDGLHEAV